MSYLTTSFEELQDALVEALEGEGFAFNPLTTSFPRYLATALGEPNAYLTKSVAQMLSEIDAQYGGSLSHLTSSVAHLMDDAAANIGAGGGGGDAYVADAVHFDGLTYLRNPALVSADGDYISMSFWVKMSAADRAVNPSIAVVDGEDQLGFNFTWYEGIPLTLALNNRDGGNTVTLRPSEATEDVWQHILISAFTNAGVGSKIAKFYINDVDVTSFNDNHGACTPILDGLEFRIGDDFFGASILGDLADFRVMPGVSLLTGGGIAEVTRRLFIDADGKPVDPAIATAALASAGAILQSGGASSFATNQGTGGAFTVFNSRNDISVVGSNGPGPISIAVITSLGVAITSVIKNSDETDVTSEFEATISVVGEIQQTGASDLSAELLTVTLTGGLTNASTSPSD